MKGKDEKFKKIQKRRQRSMLGGSLKKGYIHVR